MKQVFQGLLAVMFVGVLIANMALADDFDKPGVIKREIDIASGGEWGGWYLSDNAVESRTFSLPYGKSYAAYWHADRDSTAGWNDTIHIALQTVPDNSMALDSTLYHNHQWINVKTWTVTLATGWSQTGYVDFKYSDSDSAYANAARGLGVGRWLIYGPANDSLTDGAVGYDFYIVFEED